MEFRIKRESGRYLKEFTEFTWKQMNRKIFIRTVIMYPVLIAILISVAIVDYCGDNGSAPAAFFAMAFCFGYFFFSYLMRVSNAKHKTAGYVATMIIRFKKYESQTELVLNEEMVTYRNFETYLELKWSAFYKYAIAGNILMLTTNQIGSTGIYLHREDLPKEEFEELLKLVESKVVIRIK